MVRVCAVANTNVARPDRGRLAASGVCTDWQAASAAAAAISRCGRAGGRRQDLDAGSGAGWSRRDEVSTGSIWMVDAWFQSIFNAAAPVFVLVECDRC